MFCFHGRFWFISVGFESCRSIGNSLGNLLLMFIKKVLSSFVILRSSKLSTSMTIVFLGRFDDLSFIFLYKFLQNVPCFCGIMHVFRYFFWVRFFFFKLSRLVCRFSIWSLTFLFLAFAHVPVRCFLFPAFVFF